MATNRFNTHTRHQTEVKQRRRLRDWLKKSYWATCWDCDLCEGPFDHSTAVHRAARWETVAGEPRPYLWCYQKPFPCTDWSFAA